MAQPGVYAPSTLVSADLVVRVNGIVREHASVEFAGDTSGGLPEQVVSAGTGMRSRTGSITWAPVSPVAVEPAHPLRRVDGWPPREGDELVITATVDTGSGPYQFRRFTGRLGRTTGSLMDGSLTSEITDTLGDSLQAIVSIDPQYSEGRHYLRSLWVAYQALAQAGLAAIPGPDQWTVLWNGYQAGILPFVGTSLGAGTGFGDGYGLEVVTGARTATTGVARNGRSALVIARAGTGSGGTAPAVEIPIGGHSLTLRYSLESRTYRLSSTSVGTVGTWARTDDGPMAVLALMLTGSRAYVWTSPTTYVDVPFSSSGDIVSVNGEMLAGVSVRYLPSNVPAAPIVARTAVRPVSIRRSRLELERINATRGFEDVPARSVVDSWSEGTLGSVWMDELGGVQMCARDRLLDGPLARTVEISDRVFAGSWSIGDDTVRSQVVLGGLQAAVSRVREGEYRVVVHEESSTRGFEASAMEERFVEAPGNVDWGPIDLTFSRFGSAGLPSNAGIEGSWVGAVTTENGGGDAPEFWAQFDNVSYLTTAERLGQRTLKIVENVSGIPSGKTLYLKTASTGTEAHPAMRGVPSPIIRAEWVTTWADYTITVGGGPEWAPPLTLDASWWLTPADAQRVADALAAEVTTSMPTMSSVSVLWDPRRQIGDIEEWIARDAEGDEAWRARVLVTGYSESWDGNVPEQSVDVRVISWTDPIGGKTYADLAGVYDSYSDLSGTYQETYDALPGGTP